MSAPVLFIALMVLATCHAIARGGGPERLAAAALILATCGTVLVDRGAGFTYAQIRWGLLWIDACLFLALTAVALTADRFWPMWMAALQFVAVAVHAERAYEPGILPLAYWWLIGKLSYPIILLLVAGVERHQSRLRAALPEFDWTASRRKAGDSSAVSRGSEPEN